MSTSTTFLHPVVLPIDFIVSSLPPRFIYEVIYCADLPWVFGGEYPLLSQLIEHVVRAWINVGFALHFVFDGECPPNLPFRSLVQPEIRRFIVLVLSFISFFYLRPQACLLKLYPPARTND